MLYKRDHIPIVLFTLSKEEKDVIVREKHITTAKAKMLNQVKGRTCMQSQQKKILVVDDESDILEFLQVILEEEGYLVATTDKGEYVEKLRNGSFPDLILLDVLLSGKDGRDIVKQLKRQKETKHIPVIMFSAHPSAEEAVRACGADDFLAKLLSAAQGQRNF